MARRRRPPRSGAITELPPLRILGQIATLQAIYYVVALVLMVFTTLVSGQRFTLDLVFGWSSLRGDNTQGWLMAFIWLCCSGATYVYPLRHIFRCFGGPLDTDLNPIPYRRLFYVTMLIRASGYIVSPQWSS